MADPLSAALAVKAAVYTGTDKRVRTLIASVITGFVVLILLPFLLIISIYSGGAQFNREIATAVFNGGPIPTDISAEYAQQISLFIDIFDKLDDRIQEINEEIEGESLDDIRIKAVLFSLYFTDRTAVFDDAFYNDFVYCFAETEEISDSESEEEIIRYAAIEDMEQAYKNVSALTEKSITDTGQKNIENLYLFIRFGYTNAPVLPGYSDGGTGGGGGIGGGDMSGIPPEALNDEKFAQLMNEATKYIGFPYVWGGANPQTSFDCSGFVCWSFTQSGVYNLPRTTAQNIYNQCMPVSESDLKPGDLVFFTKTYSTTNAVTHIGIYVGGGNFLHCGDPIGYAKLSNPYWTSHFYGYGRLSS